MKPVQKSSHERRGLLAFALLALAAASSIAPSASAGVITYETPAGSTTSGGAVDASATFTTSAGMLTITLENLLANPTDVAQLISDLSFTLSSDVTGSSSLSSSSAAEVDVASDGSFATGSVVTTGWALSAPSPPDELLLNVLGTPIGPAHLIIGPPDAGGTYSDANGSIAGNPPHNPFLLTSASFTISNATITDSTTVTAATFSFGTTEGIDVVGTPKVPPSQIPEPGTLALLGLGLASLAHRRSQRQR